MTMSCSCVNSKINAFNRKLEEIMKCHEHVIVVRNYFNRVPLTRHGLHLHKLGKEMIAKHVAVICTTIKKNMVPVFIHWKDSHNNIGNAETYTCSNSN